jgi:hypothetical protein
MHKPLTREHISAIDRRRAAIHEAGHVVMARHIGLTNVSAWLEEMPDSADDILYEKLWIGHTTYLQSGIIGKKLSDKKLAMFAVAGAVSECCWQRNSYDETLDYDTWYDADTMSESDWAGCRCEPGDPSPQLLSTIEAVFLLFDRETGKLWPALLSESRRLIVTSRRTRTK